MYNDCVEDLLEASTDVDGTTVELLFANPADDDIIVDCTTELVFDTCGIYDDVMEVFAKKDFEVAFIDGETIEDVMKEEEVEDLLKASTEVDGIVIKLLFANPADDDILLDCTTELLFDTCGRYDEAIVEFAKKDLEVAFTDE